MKFNLFHKIFNKRDGERGVAILLALFTVTLVIFLANEISRQSFTEYLASASAVKKIQARHAAQACLRLNLLRIKGYQQAVQALGSVVPDPSLLEQIWSFPLPWPLTLPEEMGQMDNESLKKTMSNSLFKEQFISSISSEGGKIDINDLGSPSEGLREKTRNQILQRLEARVLNEEDYFSKLYSQFNFEELVNNIVDWVDEDQESLNGGSESSYYTELNNPFIPPNRPFKTMEELHLVQGMTDEIYEFLKSQITLYGVKGININQAEKDVLVSLFNEYDPQLVEEIVAAIIERRSDINLGGFFKDEKDFLGFLDNFTSSDQFNNQENRIPLFFDSETNFLISCTGIAGKMTTEIQAVVYDANSVKERFENILLEESQGNSELPECKGLKGQALYECQCKNITDPKRKEECITKKKNTANNQNTKKKTPILPGPPPVIFMEIK